MQIWVRDSVSLFEVSLAQSVWMTFSTNSNTFEDEVSGGGLQVGHQSTEGFSVEEGDSPHRIAPLLFSTTGSLSILSTDGNFVYFRRRVYVPKSHR